MVDDTNHGVPSVVNPRTRFSMNKVIRRRIAIDLRQREIWG